MSNRMPPIALAVSIVAGLACGLAFESVYRVSARERVYPMPVSATIGAASIADAEASPLFLRLVDSGGIGMPLSGEWGTDYSHDTRVFHEAILQHPPYVDETAFARVEQQWHAYVERMLAYGNNAISVPLFLELIDF